MVVKNKQKKLILLNNKKTTPNIECGFYLSI